VTTANGTGQQKSETPSCRTTRSDAGTAATGLGDDLLTTGVVAGLALGDAMGDGEALGIGEGALGDGEGALAACTQEARTSAPRLEVNERRWLTARV
jgi:hypothetical protein